MNTYKSVHITGMLEIFLPGTYVFTTKSDDGSHLYVDGTIGSHCATHCNTL